MKIPLHREIVRTYREILRAPPDPCQAKIIQWIRELRCQGGLICPRCESRIEPLKLGPLGECGQQRFRCPACRETFNTLTGTVFAGAKQPLSVVVQGLRIVKQAPERAGAIRELAKIVGHSTASRWYAKFTRHLKKEPWLDELLQRALRET
jgi:transposase-like protein